MATKERRALRAVFTKEATNFEALLEESHDECELEARFNILTCKYNKLVECDEKIKTELLSKDSTTDEDLETEIESTGTYEYKYFLLKKKFEKAVKEEMNSNRSHRPSSCCTRESPSSVKLPDISNKFDGNLGNWIGFWTQFSRIHDSGRWEDEDKFEILLRSLKPDSSPRKLVQGFPPSKENYAKAVDLLKQRFGRDDLLIEFYVRQLLNLVLSKEKVVLSDLYDQLETQLRALSSMGVTQEKYVAMLFPLVESAVPEPLFKIWERVRSSKNASMKNPEECLQELLEFLRVEVEGEERLKLRQQSFEKKVSDKGKAKPEKPDLPSAAAFVTTESKKGKPAMSLCIFCNKNHPSQECAIAMELPIEKLNEMVRKKGVCFRCLRTGHLISKCRVTVKCVICKGKHFPIFCTEKKNSNSAEENVKTSSFTAKVNSYIPHAYLQTLKVYLTTPSNKTVVARVLLDSGSMKSYITQSLVQMCGFKSVETVRLTQELFGGQKTEQKTRKVFKVLLRSIDGDFESEFDLIEQEKICGKLARCEEPDVVTFLKEKEIILTDFFDYNNDLNDEVDILLGADALPVLHSPECHTIKGMLVIRTNLGWTVTGSPNTTDTEDRATTSLLIKLTEEVSISRFWDLETLGITDGMSKIDTDNTFFENFENSIKRNFEGRYVVSLPFIEGAPNIEDNRWHAESRLRNTTRKLNQQGLYSIYDDILQDWRDKSIVEIVPEDEVANSSYYLPHRAVIKQESTTKCRPVFDAGCKDKNGHSLNELLEKGPNLIEKIPTSLINFRKGCIGVSADIEKAFLQIVIQEKDRDFLRFLWWDHNNKVITMRHCRVVFGVTSSPFQLCAVLKHHLKRAPPELKDTADRLLKAFYVDNCLTAFESEYEYEIFKKEAQYLLMEAGFNLRGWITNRHSPEKVENILGLNWICGTDQLGLNIQKISQKCKEKKWTRRDILSIVQQVFDPIGMATPFTLVPRIILQETWNMKGVGWDDQLTEDLQDRFQRWYDGVELLQDCLIKRDIILNEYSEVHVMCDASKSAYASCVFVVTSDSCGLREVRLVMAKSRVAPMKLLTIPRLELMAAVMGVRLFDSVSSALGLNKKVVYWTDSSVVLNWIINPGPWSVFVSNRVQEILLRTAAGQWRHLPGVENPADLLSRGCNALHLISSRWWEGPGWLKRNPEDWPKSRVNPDINKVNEERRKTAVTVTTTDSINFSDSFLHISDYGKILRVVAWMLRWKIKRNGEINGDEIKIAELRLLKCIQSESINFDKKLAKSMLTFKDSDGILRVKTKLLLSEEDSHFTCPILMPSNHFVTERMIYSLHVNNCHASTSILLGIIRENFWVLRGRKTVKRVVSGCVRCKRYSKSKPLDPPFAPLPKDRVTCKAAFEVSGVDLAGPMYVKGGGKVWIVIFTCAVYRAIHLELVEALSTVAFVRSLRRFIARRGRILVLYADNGTNFHGTSNYLAELDWEEITRTTSLQKITWKFNPPSAAWWGGWWERLIGLLKPLLVRNLGRSSLALDELSTLICECEALLNERPLTYVSDDTTDLKPLKPSMFLRELPSCEVTDFDRMDGSGLNRRLRYLQNIRKSLKQRFKKEYLAQLIHHGWRKNEQVQVNDIVLIGSDHTKRIQWPLGRVVEVFPGPDGIVRVAKVKTESGIFTRPLQRLYPLEVCHIESKTSVKRGNEEESLDSGLEVKHTKTRCGRTVNKPCKLNL